MWFMGLLKKVLCFDCEKIESETVLVSYKLYVQLWLLIHCDWKLKQYFSHLITSYYIDVFHYLHGN
jgi:hypothetical protein